MYTVILLDKKLLKPYIKNYPGVKGEQLDLENKIEYLK